MSKNTSMSHHLAFQLKHKSAPIDRLAELLLIASNLDAIDLSIFAILSSVLELSEAEKFTINLALSTPLDLLVVSL